MNKYYDKKYFKTNDQCPYIMMEKLTIINLAEKKECTHQHTEIKKIIHCLFSYNKFEKGWEIAYILTPLCKKYYGKCCRENAHNFPPVEIITYQDSRFPEEIKKQIIKSYTYYRNRYNPALPENFFKGEIKYIDDVYPSQEVIQECIEKQSNFITTKLKEYAAIQKAKDANSQHLQNFSFLPNNSVNEETTKETKCCNFEQQQNIKDNYKIFFDHLAYHGLTRDIIDKISSESIYEESAIILNKLIDAKAQEIAQEREEQLRKNTTN